LRWTGRAGCAPANEPIVSCRRASINFDPNTDRMSTVGDEDTFIATAASVPTTRPRRLRAILAVFMTQYTLVAIVVSLLAACIFRYLVMPQIVAKFELIAAALKR
jgi:hypothetical protein